MKKQNYNHEHRIFAVTNCISYYYDHKFNFQINQVHKFFDKWYLGDNKPHKDLDLNESHQKIDLINIEDSVDAIIKDMRENNIKKFKNGCRTKRKLARIRHGYSQFIFLQNDKGVKHYRTDNNRAYYDLSNIKNDLFYISDRWRCVGRLLWLKEVIKYYKNNKG